jgi:CRISPR-associated protein Cas2
MMILVTYDVSTVDLAGKRRLQRVAKICEDFGQRVQNSVFECLIDPAEWATLRSKLAKTADLKKDSLRFYFLGANWQRRVEHLGAKETYDPEGLLLLE